MPNWCNTTITFHGKNAKKLNDLITKWTEESLSDVAFGSRWLGNCLVNSGILEFKDAAFGEIRCRGSIEYYDLTDDEELTVVTETAWSPMLKMWDIINKKLNLNLEIIYTAEEPGLEVYMTNDPSMKDIYAVDIYIDKEDYPFGYEIQDYEVPKEKLEEIKKEMKAIFPFAKNFDEMDRHVGDNSFVSVHEYEFVDIENLD